MNKYKNINLLKNKKNESQIKSNYLNKVYIYTYIDSLCKKNKKKSRLSRIN